MHLTLHLTKGCNMACDYCYSQPRMASALSFETGRKALMLGARLSPQSCGIVFFGGEPLLHKALITSLVAEARAMERDGRGRFHFKLTTNGLLLDDEFLRFSVEHDVLVAMSFDGVRPAHDAHRRLVDGSPSYDILLPHLRRLLAVRPYATVLTVVNPDTARHLSASIEFLLEQGARHLIVSLNYAGSWTAADFRILRAEYEKLADLYVKWSQAERKFYLSPFEVKLSSHINRHDQHRERCELAARQVSVDPDGYVFPCVQFAHTGRESTFCIGHVDSGIDEVARSRIRAQAKKESEICQDCAVKDRCNHTCGCLNWQTTGDINGISPVLCEHERMLIPIADRVGQRLYRGRVPAFLHKHYNAAYPVLSLLEEAADSIAWVQSKRTTETDKAS